MLDSVHDDPKESYNKRFRFQKFSDRIAAISINPIHRLGRRFYETEESYFVDAWKAWAEKNMTTTFNDFLDETAKISKSLPLVLHHKKEIADSLLKYLARADKYSAEPLLDLIPHFAHDLGVDFEPFFAPTLKTLIEVLDAGWTNDVDGIDANCRYPVRKFLKPEPFVVGFLRIIVNRVEHGYS